MKKILKKYRILHFLNIFLVITLFLSLLAFHDLLPISFILISIISIIILNVSFEYMLNKCSKEELAKKELMLNEKTEKEFQDSIKNVYDEHIFSITHELRSPLSVISSSIHNQTNNIKTIYNALPYELKEKYTSTFTNIKKNLKIIKNQSEIIESFIASIAEHGSYVTDKGQKILNLHNYLLSVIINSYSYSRNMKVFTQSNIAFGDNKSGEDFAGVNCVVHPHDLSRMLVNIMTNSADAISAHYKEKKYLNNEYSPFIKIRCIKSKDPKNKICLNNEFLRVNGDFNDCQPFYMIIEDNGPGITDSNIKKIFKYGFTTKSKTDEDSNTPISHFGLGLHVVMKLAELNEIKVYIKTDKNGTMVVLGFPYVIYDNATISDDSKELYNKYVICESKNDEYIKYDKRYCKLKEESTTKRYAVNPSNK